MKKRRTVLIICLTLVLALATGTLFIEGNSEGKFVGWFRENNQSKNISSTAAVVNGKEIYFSQIEMVRKQLQFSLQNGLEQLETASDLTEEEKNIMKAELEAEANQTDDEILNNLIRQEVLLQEAKKQGLEISDETAHQQASDNYFAMKEAATASNAPDDAIRNYQAICDYLKASGLSEDEYLQQIGEVYQRQMTQAALYEAFCNNTENLTTTIQPTEFENYVDSLVNSADVEKR